MFGNFDPMHEAVGWLIGIVLWKTINLFWEDGKWPFSKK